MKNKIREEAALICQIAASNTPITPNEVAEALQASEAAIELALEARLSVLFDKAFNFMLNGNEIRAEAEARLRTGWTPKAWLSTL